MNSHSISKSTFCSGTLFDPNNNSLDVSIRVITNSVYLNLKFYKRETPIISISVSGEIEYNNAKLKNIVTFKQFKELFYHLTGQLFDVDVNNWADFDYS